MLGSLSSGDVLLEDFLTTYISFQSVPEVSVILVTFESTAFFDPMSPIFPTESELINELLNAFTGNELSGYVGMVQALPTSNIFSSATEVYLVGTPEADVEEETPVPVAPRDSSVVPIVVTVAVGLMFISALSAALVYRRRRHRRRRDASDKFVNGIIGETTDAVSSKVSTTHVTEFGDDDQDQHIGYNGIETNTVTERDALLEENEDFVLNFRKRKGSKSSRSTNSDQRQTERIRNNPFGEDYTNNDFGGLESSDCSFPGPISYRLSADEDSIEDGYLSVSLHPLEHELESIAEAAADAEMEFDNEGFEERIACASDDWNDERIAEATAALLDDPELSMESDESTDFEAERFENSFHSNRSTLDENLETVDVPMIVGNSRSSGLSPGGEFESLRAQRPRPIISRDWGGGERCVFQDDNDLGSSRSRSMNSQAHSFFCDSLASHSFMTESSHSHKFDNV